MSGNEPLLTEEGEQRRISVVTRWLENVSAIISRVHDFENRAAAMRQRADNLRGIDYSRAAVKTSPTPDAIPDAIIAADELGELFEGLASDAKRRIASAEAALMSMTDQTEARALSLYYLTFDGEGKRACDTWERVCVEMGYTYDGMMKLVRRAKLHAYDVMPPSERDAVPIARPREYD